MSRYSRYYNTKRISAQAEAEELAREKEESKLYFPESEYSKLPKFTPYRLMEMVIMTDWYDQARPVILAELACRIGLDIIGHGRQRYMGHEDPACEFGFDVSEPGSSSIFHVSYISYPGSWRHWKPSWTVSVRPAGGNWSGASKAKAKELTEALTQHFKKTTVD